MGDLIVEDFYVCSGKGGCAKSLPGSEYYTLYSGRKKNVCKLCKNKATNKARQAKKQELYDSFRMDHPRILEKLALRQSKQA